MDKKKIYVSILLQRTHLIHMILSNSTAYRKKDQFSAKYGNIFRTTDDYCYKQEPNDGL